jgi:hypothetical protein
MSNDKQGEKEKTYINADEHRESWKKGFEKGAEISANKMQRAA